MDYRPNQELTATERNTKHELKRLLKQQHHLYKLEMRFKQAVKRHDHAVANATREALAEFLRNENVCDAARRDVFLQQKDDAREQAARRFVERVYFQLQQSWGITTKDQRKHIVQNPQYTSKDVKERRLQEARELLRNMTKGTQHLEQFANTEALRGYTRHKFVERAMLVASSLCKLQAMYFQNADTSEAASSPTEAASQATIYTMMERLRAVQSVWSIGCGPGCDAVGVVAFLREAIDNHHTGNHHQGETTKNNSNDSTVLDRVVLLDWAMPQWEPIVQSVKQLLVQKHNLVKHMETATCDVRASLYEQNHSQCDDSAGTNVKTHASDAITNGDLLSRLASKPSQSLNEEVQLRNVDLVVVSYLFSETRGKWHLFVDDLVELSAVGTLFLITDPTAWQLHLFRERYEFYKDNIGGSDRRRRMDFLWLDSSMYRPELQELEGRNGAAVLLGMKIEEHS
jgi:hypothetical protein